MSDSTRDDDDNMADDDGAVTMARAFATNMDRFNTATASAAEYHNTGSLFEPVGTNLATRRVESSVLMLSSAMASAQEQLVAQTPFISRIPAVGKLHFTPMNPLMHSLGWSAGEVIAAYIARNVNAFTDIKQAKESKASMLKALAGAAETACSEPSLWMRIHQETDKQSMAGRNKRVNSSV